MSEERKIWVQSPFLLYFMTINKGESNESKD